jgi:hypothetical protein
MVETEYWLAKLINGDVIEVLITQQDRGDTAPWSFRWRYRGKPVEGTLYRDRKEARRSALKCLANEKLDLISWSFRPPVLPPKEEMGDDEEIVISRQQLLVAIGSLGNAVTDTDVVGCCFDRLIKQSMQNALPKFDELIRSGDVEMVLQDTDYRILRLTDAGRTKIRGLTIDARPSPMPVLTEDVSAPLWQLVLTTMATMGTVTTVEDIIVRCFERHPKQFGMIDYPFCDSNRVLPKLYGLISAGNVEMIAPRVVRITSRGRLQLLVLQCLGDGLSIPTSAAGLQVEEAHQPETLASDSAETLAI